MSHFYNLNKNIYFLFDSFVALRKILILEMEVSFDKYYKTATLLSLFTIIYNLLEGLESTFLGFEEEALSLFGFEVDSFIEMISRIGILVMIRRIERNPASHTSEFEKKTLRITAYCLYALAILLVLTDAWSIFEKHEPKNILPGVIIASISIRFMWYLIKEK